MANAFTGTAAMTNLVQTTYDRALEFALRAQPMFRMVADKRPVQQAMPGSSVVFELYQDLDNVAPTTPLNELTDPDAVAAGNPTTVSVTLNEYGNAILVSNKLDLFSFTDVTAGLVNQVAWNLVDTVDLLVQNVLAGGTQVIRQNGDPASVAPTYNGGTTDLVGATSTYSSKAARLAVAKLRAQKVHPNKGSYYTTYIHPEVSHDLRAETGNAAWRDPHNYSAAGNIWAGEIGEYEGSVFIETPRCQNELNAGGPPATRVFQTYTTGQQALAEAVAEEFHTVRGPVVDKLTRFQPLGWYGVAGWSLYRPEALIRTETTSSINNA
uniref:Major head protein n=1 Tax=Streptomyces phage Abafar TaxID=3158855 RepID=A0AAU7GZX5_9CAUD